MKEDKIKEYEVLKLAFKAVDDGNLEIKKLEKVEEYPKENYKLIQDNIKTKIFIIRHYQYYFKSIISEILEGEHLEL